MRRGIGLGVAAVTTLTVVAAVSTASLSSPEEFEDVRYVQQISRDRHPFGADAMRDTEVGPHVAVDPNDPTRVVAVFQQNRLGAWGARAHGFATSHDGGKGWVAGSLPGLTQLTGGQAKRASDPVAAFGPGGVVYASATIATHTLCPTGVAVQRSGDGGLTWEFPVAVQWDLDCTVNNNDTWITVDNDPSSPFHGRVYLVWDRDLELYLAVSDDQGVTWSTPRAISPEDVSTVSPVALVQPGGDVTVVYSDWFDDVILSQTSHDGGATFDPVERVAAFDGVDPPDMWTGALDNQVSAAVDQSTGHMHVAWEDQRLRTDGLNDVLITTSSDGGASWSAVRRVNTDPPDSNFDHLVPAVAAAGGFVHVTYLFRDMTGGLNQQVVQRYLLSPDGGITFGGERDLGQPYDLTWGARFGNDYLALPGETVGLAATEARAYVVWPRATMPLDIVLVYHQTTWSATIVR